MMPVLMKCEKFICPGGIFNVFNPKVLGDDAMYPSPSLLIESTDSMIATCML